MDDNFQSDLSSYEEEPGERLEPLGACNCDEIVENFCKSGSSSDRIRELEEEQEVLNSALFALTTHFAQVQFRLRQIANTSSEKREGLLNSLEQFAAEGIPDLELIREKVDTTGLQEEVKRHRAIQKTQIKKLRAILEGLEFYVALIENDNGMDRELVEMKSKLNDEYCKYMEANNNKQVFMNNICFANGHNLFVEQLKLQVNDLENFIEFLKSRPRECVCSKFSYKIDRNSKAGSFIKLGQEILLLVNFLAVFQTRCAQHIFYKNPMDKMIKGKHWGDLRAKLELSIHRILRMVLEDEQNYRIINVVRDDLCVSLQNLIEHGTKSTGNFLPWLCWNQKANPRRHAWELILKFYHLNECKNKGVEPIKKLAQSFDLDINGILALNDRETLLSTIERIYTSHSKYKKGNEAQFKAFVCAGLNYHKLVVWLRMVFRCSQLITDHYHSWSYAGSTGFEDSLNSLDKLTNYEFNLPVDSAIFNLENIDDAFI